MDELIKAFVAGGGIDMEIKKTDKLLWLSYLGLSLEDRKTLEHIGFVFTKHTIRRTVPVIKYKKVSFLYLFSKVIKVVENESAVEETVVMRARPVKPTLGEI